MQLRLKLVDGSQTARAEVQPLGLAVLDNGHLLDVCLPLAIGAHVGMANVMPKSWPFPAQITFCHDFTSHMNRASRTTAGSPLELGGHLTTSWAFSQTGRCPMQGQKRGKKDG